MAAAQSWSGAPEGEASPEFPVLDWRAIAAVLPDVPWVNQGLQLAPGRPYVFCGEAGSKKSWWGQALLVHAAVDVPLLGKFPFRKGGARCLHIDYEQGEPESRRRYQALAAGLGCGETLFRDPKRLGYVWQPIETFMPESERARVKAFDALCRLVTGYDLVMVDSLIDCQPGVEENASEISLAMKMATRVSTRTGTAFVFIDHASNKSQDTKRGNAQRGHSSKKGACSVLLVASGDGRSPIKVTCERSQVGSFDARPPDFYYDLHATDKGGILMVTAEPPADATPGMTLKTLADALRRAIDDNPGLSLDELRALMGVRKSDLIPARDMLERENVITNTGTKGRPAWHIVSDNV